MNGDLNMQCSISTYGYSSSAPARHAGLVSGVWHVCKLKSEIVLQDPEIISRLLVAGNDAVQQAAEKFMAKRDRIIQEDSRQFPPPG